jgi:hypothetical protein
LSKAEAYASRLQTINTRLLVAGLLNSAGATLVAGVTAAGGPIVGEGIPGWRLACIVAAVLGFVSTVTIGLSQQLKISERLANGQECLGKLRRLDLSIATGSRNWDEITEEYQSIVATYPDVI